MIKTEVVQQNFSRFPAEYDMCAETQKKCAKKLSTLIKGEFSTTSPSQILEIGCGTGFLTNYLIKEFSDSSFIITDLSNSMLNFCKKKITKEYQNSTLKFTTLNATTPIPYNNIDLITSSLAFQWIENIEELFKSANSALSKNGRLIFSTLLTGTFNEIKMIFNKHQVNFPMPHLLLEKDIHKAAKNANFSEITFKTATYTETHSDIKNFLDHIHKVGAGNATGTPISIPQLRKIIKSEKVTKNIKAEYIVLFAILKK